MFVEFVPTTADGTGGTKTFIKILNAVATGNNVLKAEATTSTYCSFYHEYSTGAGGWTEKLIYAGPTEQTPKTEIHAPVAGKADKPAYRKGFAVRTNSTTYNNHGNLSGFLGSFATSDIEATTYGNFDYARPLNFLGAGEAGNEAPNRRDSIDQWGTVAGKRWVISVNQSFIFVGCVTNRTFWYVGNASASIVHGYPNSDAVPMIGLSGMGNGDNTQYYLQAHLHKYQPGVNISRFNNLLSTSQDITVTTGDSYNNFNDNLIKMYPNSTSESFISDRYNRYGNQSTAVYPFMLGNHLRGNAWQIPEGIVLLSGKNHQTGEVFYVSGRRYYKFSCTHNESDTRNRGLNIGILMQ
jgi:hypothetical protein